MQTKKQIIIADLVATMLYLGVLVVLTLVETPESFTLGYSAVLLSPIHIIGAVQSVAFLNFEFLVLDHQTIIGHLPLFILSYLQYFLIAFLVLKGVNRFTSTKEV